MRYHTKLILVNMFLGLSIATQDTTSRIALFVMAIPWGISMFVTKEEE